MTRTSFALLLFFTTLVSCEHKAGPVISYKSKLINLGDIQFKKEYAGDIVISNKGDALLKLLNVTADCSCTVPEIEKKEIGPGDSSVIHFKISPSRDGYIQQNIYLDNNSVNENRALFLIRARVKVLNN